MIAVKTQELFSKLITFLKPEFSFLFFVLSKLFLVLSDSENQPLKAGRQGACFLDRIIVSECGGRSQKRWSCLDERNSPERRRREIARKIYWDYKEAYISLLLQTSFLLIIIPTLYFPPAEAAGKDSTSHKQMSTYLNCLTTLPWTMIYFCSPTSTEHVVGIGTQVPPPPSCYIH